MDSTRFNRLREFDELDRIPFKSPYVEINDDNNESSSSHFNETTPLVRNRGSVNSFLEEAEIISPSSEEKIAKEDDLMRKKIKHYFMNPIQKWKIKNRFPWKLCLQIIIIFIGTLQLSDFGMKSYNYVTQHADMSTALSQFLLKDWTSDVTVYPPSTGPYAVFTIPEFYENINHVIKQYTKISTLPIGPYSYDNLNGTLSPMILCVKHYDGDIFPENASIAIHGKPSEKCTSIPALYPAGSELWNNFTLETFLQNFTINFKTLIKAQLHFKLKTIFIKSMTKLDVPECYRLKNIISYDNSDHDGQLLISLKIRSTKVNCSVHSKVENDREDLHLLLRQLLNVTVIILCLMSVILCIRSLYSGYKLSTEVVEFFKAYYSKDIPTWELLDFVDFWYINIVVSDILLIFGSVIKVQIEEKSAEGNEYSKCTILLGVGNLLLWVGLLRYLGFFPKYNMLILTIKRALPNVLRFTLCAVFLYVGFCFCGWIVLAPYHIKFRTLSRSSECLFAVMNGDDMFATFALIETKNKLIWWFSRIYLYLFLLLFIYVVISLFISVIMDTFETIKISYLYGSPPKTTVEIFLATEPHLSESSPFTETPFTGTNEAGFVTKTWNWMQSKFRK